MSRAQARLSLPARGVYVIEASAGTGKTFELSLLYLQAVLERGMLPGEILVVTFTEAAARDLSRRIGGVLTRATGLLDSLVRRVEPGGGLDAGTLASAVGELVAAADRRDPLVERIVWIIERAVAVGTALDLARARVRGALRQFEQHAISTIHAFAAAALAEFPGETGVPLGATRLVDGVELAESAAADLWREHVTAADGSAWLAHYPSPHELLATLAPLLDRRRARHIPADPRLELSRARTLLATAFESLAPRWPSQCAEALGLIRSARRILSFSASHYREDNLARAEAALAAYFAGGIPQAGLDPAAELLSAPRLLAGRTAGAAAGGLAPPQHSLFDALADLLAQHARATALARACERLDLAAALESRIRRAATAGGVRRFDDLIGDLHDVLQGPDGERLAARMAARWPLAMIDEFQDTDTNQYRIFQRIYRDPLPAAADPGDSVAGAVPAGHERCLILVGDPKQSIYRFRGGDVFAYARALADADGVLGRLATNYRSEAKVVAATNVLFLGAPFEQEFIRYFPSTASDRPLPGVLRDPRMDAGLVIWDGGVGDGRQRAREPLMEQAIETSADEIVRLLSGEVTIERDQSGAAQTGSRRLRADDIAVLVPRRVDALRIARSLEARGVGVALNAQASVYASASARDLHTILAAIAWADEPRSVRTALATAGFDWTLAALLTPEAGAFTAARAEFRQWQEAWLREGSVAALSPLLARIAPALARRHDGARRLTDLRQLIELLIAAPVAQDEPEALLAYLAERLDTEETNVDAEAVRPEPGGARVRVLTVHKSKGLEFGIVFLPLAWWVLERDPADDFVVFHDDSDEACLDLGSESIGAHRMRAAREAEAERVRLAYVMLTRARHRTYAVIGKVRSGYRAGIAQVLFHPLDSSGYELLSADGYRAHLARRLGESPRGEGILHLDLPAPAAKPPHLASAEGAAAIESEPLLRAPPGPVPTWSYSALKQLGRQGEEGALPGRHDELADPDEFHGARFGRCFHEFMEGLAFDAGPARLAAATVATLTVRHGLPAAAGARLIELADAALAAELLLGFRLPLLRPEQALREVPFLLRLGDASVADLAALLRRYPAHDAAGAALEQQPARLEGWLRGYLDLVFEWQGRYYVLDYKTDKLGLPARYAGPELADEISARGYDLQYLIYAVALRRWLQRRFPADGRARFGGVLYLFARGIVPGTDAGVFRAQPDPALLDAIEVVLTEKCA